MMASAGISHIVVCVQGPAKSQHVLPVLLAQLVFGQLEVLEPGEELRRKDLRAAVERVAGEPDHLLLAEAHGARMIELLAQLALVDLLGEAHRCACG